MSTVTVDEVQALAHCRDRGCVGYEQQPVVAVKTVRSDTYQDAGGDGTFNGEYRSSEHLTFADETDRECPYCDQTREVTVQERPVYAPATSQKAEDHRQDGQMTRLLVEQAEKSAKLEAQFEQLAQAKRGPGRPRKDEAA